MTPGETDGAAPVQADEGNTGGESPLAKRKVKQSMDSKRHTLPHTMKEPFTEHFDELVAKMPNHVRDRVIMRQEIPQKPMERNAYVGIYAHQFKSMKV